VVVTQAELRGQSFTGQVARTAASIDAATRTMQVEIALSNPDGALMPGAFVQAALPLKPSGALVIPTDALLFRRDGTMVAVVDDKLKVRLQTVQIGRNYGQTVEVLNGIKGNERLILNPSDSVAEGDEVALAAEPKAKS